MTAQVVEDHGFMKWLYSLARVKRQQAKIKKNGSRSHTDEFLQLQEEIEKLKKATDEFRNLDIWSDEQEVRMRQFCQKTGVKMPELL